MSARFPATMQVFERGWLSSNNILFTGPHENILVDSGYLTHADQTLALVEHALGGGRLDRLLNTHLHSDHCGGNAALQARYGCRTAIPHAEADKVSTWDEDALSYKATGQQCARFGFDDTIDPGDRCEMGGMEWQALSAAGHDPHSLMFYCAGEGILLSADALWQNGFGVIFPELQGEPGFDEARATIDLIAMLDVRLVVPGGAGAVADRLPAGRAETQRRKRGQGLAQISAARTPAVRARQPALYVRRHSRHRTRPPAVSGAYTGRTGAVGCDSTGPGRCRPDQRRNAAQPRPVRPV